METKKHIEEILWRYFEGNAIPEEIDFISDWLDQSQENRQLFVATKKAFIEIGADAISDPEMITKAFDRFLGRVNSAVWKEKMDRQQRLKRLSTVSWRYASVILFLLSLSSIIFIYKTHSGSAFDDNYCEIQVPYGARSLLTLPDGSKVWLNAGSKLKYNRNFGVKSRDVYLEGEAYFDVEKRKHPFFVHTSFLDLQVLGTTFNVKAYPEEENIEATLVEGSLRVESKSSSRPLFLKPKEKLTFRKADMKLTVSRIDQNKLSEQVDSGKSPAEIAATGKLSPVLITEDVNTDESTSWKDGKLVINNESLKDLTKKLERKYDITFRFDSEFLKKYSYSGTLRDFPLEQVLKALELTSPIRYTIKEKTVTLSYNAQFKPLSK